MMRQVLTLILAVLLVTGLAWVGVPEWLGAHPFWAVKIGWIGAAVGAVLAVVLALMRLGATVRAGLGLAILLGGFAAAKIGAARFAASYAEDAFAGKMWYFGWIGAAAGLCLLVWAVASARQG